MTSLLVLGRGKNPYFLSGLFVLAGLLLLAGWLTVKVFGQTFHSHDYYAYLTDVTGLRIGTPVMVAGYRIGQVVAIVHRDPGARPKSERAAGKRKDCAILDEDVGPGAGQRYFRLQLAIDKSWRLTTGTQVSLENPSLLGQPIIDLEPGSGTPLCRGSAIRFTARPASDVPDITALTQHADAVLTALNTILEEAKSEQLPRQAGNLLAELRKTVAHLDAAALELDAFIADPKFSTVKVEAERAARQVNAILEEARQLAHEARSVSPTLVEALNELRPPLNNAAENLGFATRLTATRLPGLLSDLERSAQDLSGLIADLRSNPPAALRGRDEETPTWPGTERR